MSNINCQMSQHINVKSISMSNVKCHVSKLNAECQISWYLRSQYILWDLRRSCEISRDLMRSQLGCIVAKVCRLGKRIDCIKILSIFFRYASISCTDHRDWKTHIPKLEIGHFSWLTVIYHLSCILSGWWWSWTLTRSPRRLSRPTRRLTRWLRRWPR